MSGSYEVLGPFVAGERPEPWIHTFQDVNGAAIAITGWAVNTTWKVNDGTQQERAGTISDGAGGKARHVWNTGDLDTSGIVKGEMTVSGGGLILTRSFQAVVLSPGGGTL